MGYKRAELRELVNEPLTDLREAVRYALGYDVAGWEAHLSDDEIQEIADRSYWTVRRALEENSG